MEDLSSKPLLLFDGVCNLCNGAVQWVIRRDPEARIRFGTLQSETGRRILRRAGLPERALSTVIFYRDGQLYTRSDAALEVLRTLGGFWSLFYLLRIVPRPIRNQVYDWVARNRYRWFGQRESCMIPTPELRNRFVD